MMTEREQIIALKNEIALLKTENKNLKSSKECEDALADHDESQVRFKTVFEYSRLGNKIISGDLEILEVNPAMLVVLGYDTKEEVIGTKILHYAPSEYKKDWSILQEHLWDKRTPSFSLETCLMKKDGTIIWCHVTSILFPDRGQTLGYTIIEDITEEHNLRQQKEEFIALASHELKTPITSLHASLQLMNRMLAKDPNTSEKLLKLARNTELYTVKLTNLVGDLLSSTKIEQGQLSLNKSRFMLADVIDGCCTHIELEEKYNIVYKGDKGLEIFADEQKIDQVIINFVNNAVKYAPESLDILIETKQLDNHIKVSVTDKGPGIPAENMPKLFDRYFRVNKVRDNVSGLGLGLYISAEIVRRHGGEIGAESEVGTGSTFWFTIPEEEHETLIPEVTA